VPPGPLRDRSSWSRLYRPLHILQQILNRLGRTGIRKLHRDFDPTDRLAALAALEEAEKKGEVLTGVLYVNTAKPTFLELLNLADDPLATLPLDRVRPSRAVLDEVMEELR
jgi:2-oxoglutarate ferredoxin oxidoreductase subunit beta